MQVIAPPPAVAPAAWSTSRACRRRPRARRRGAWPREEAGRPFDLERGPLLRAALLRLGAAEHALLLDVHHIVVRRLVDGRAGARDRGALPAPRSPAGPRRCRSCRSSTPTSPSGSGGGSRARCWSASSPTGGERLAGAPARSTCRPTGRGRPCRASAAPRDAVPLGACERAPGWLRPARRHGATRSWSCSPASQALLGALHRPGGRASSARRSPTATGAEIEPLIGFFVNTLVLRARPRGRSPLPRAARPGAADRPGGLRAPGPPLRAAGRGAAAGARPGAQPAVPGHVRAAERAALRPDRLPGRSSLAPVDVRRPRPRFDLELTSGRRGRPGRCSSTYSTELFDAADRPAAGWPLRDPARGGVLADPACRSRRCRCWRRPSAISSSAEWNDTGPPEARAAPASSCSRRRRRGRPDAVALVAGGEGLTYARARPPGRPARPPAAPPGRRARRSRVGLLARALAGDGGRHPRRLKAGGAYVPLDPRYPRGAPGLHAGGRGRARARRRGRRRTPARCARAGVGPRSAEADRGGSRAAEPARAVGPETSPTSSTPRARPAGPRACWSRTAASRTLVRWHADLRLRPGRPDALRRLVLLRHLPLRALGPLLAAGAVPPLPRRPGCSLERLLAELAARGITALRRADAAAPAAPRAGARRGAGCALRALLTGGDRAGRPASPPCGAFPAARLNLYGPTESGDRRHLVRCRAAAAAVPPPIGRPIADTRVLRARPRRAAGAASACRASSGSAAPAWRAAISGGRS